METNRIITLQVTQRQVFAFHIFILKYKM